MTYKMQFIANTALLILDVVFIAWGLAKAFNTKRKNRLAEQYLLNYKKASEQRLPAIGILIAAVIVVALNVLVMFLTGL